MTSPRNRRLTEEEVAFIIKRATELEASESSRVAYSPASTLTLDQVEQIAADSQIDPRMVQRAAAELAARGVREDSNASRSFVARVIGSPVHLLVQRVSDGHVSSDKEADALDMMRRTFDDQASALSSETRWEWSSSSSIERSKVSFQRLIRAQIITRQDVTFTAIDENLRPLALALMAGSTTLGVAAAMILTSGAFGLPEVHSMAVGLSWVAVGVGASVFSARKIFRRISAWRARQLSTVADRIDSILAG